MAEVFNERVIDDLEERRAFDLHPCVRLDISLLAADSEHDLGGHTVLSEQRVASAGSIQARVWHVDAMQAPHECLAEPDPPNDSDWRRAGARPRAQGIELGQGDRKRSVRKEGREAQSE